MEDQISGDGLPRGRTHENSTGERLSRLFNPPSVYDHPPIEGLWRNDGHGYEPDLGVYIPELCDQLPGVLTSKGDRVNVLVSCKQQKGQGSAHQKMWQEIADLDCVARQLHRTVATIVVAEVYSGLWKVSSAAWTAYAESHSVWLTTPNGLAERNSVVESIRAHLPYGGACLDSEADTLLTQLRSLYGPAMIGALSTAVFAADIH